MDGLLIIDKPVGPTSHEVVARVRRALGEPRIGHTGTLDPAASGVLPLVLGRATRLARFLSADSKSYDAAIRLGVATDTHDAEGTAVGRPYEGPLPSREAIERALDGFRGTFLQRPPAYSAKKIDGRRSYRIARAQAKREASGPPATPALPATVSVTAHAVDLIAVDGNALTLRVDCSAGFYVRALAHDLGERLGTGAHLFRLRRTRCGDVRLDRAVPLEALEREPALGLDAMVPLSDMLPGFSSVTLTSEGVRRAAHGRDLRPTDIEQRVGSSHPGRIAEKPPDDLFFKLIDSAGGLVAIATPTGTSGLLHPAVVLV
jgi:tRNA pseudouridine55 synthase